MVPETHDCRAGMSRGGKVELSDNVAVIHCVYWAGIFC